MRGKKLAVLALCAALGAGAEKPKLRFNAEGKFKIAQFTDLHYTPEAPDEPLYAENIRKVLDAERPDLAVYTGDVIWKAKDPIAALRAMMVPAAERGVPFCVTFGNHDRQFGKSLRELFDALKEMPLNLTDSVRGVEGASNFILKVLPREGKGTAALIYGLDSHMDSRLKGVDGYDYIAFSQVDWYRRSSAELTRENGGQPLPALAFFHIPLPEYRDAQFAEKAAFVGTRRERVCSPQLNTGLFAAMREAGDVMGVFVGHDHVNDYVVKWHDIALGYGYCSGAGGSIGGYAMRVNGARLIELTEGERSFRTWVRLRTGEVLDRVEFPADFR